MSNFRRRLMCVQQHGGLPAEYQQVEYIESTGTQWIDTGIKPTNKLKLKIQVQVITDLNLYDTAILGSYGKGYALLCTNKNNYRGWIIQWGTNFAEYNVKDNLKHIHTIDLLNKMYTLDDNKYEMKFNIAEYPNTNNIYIFGSNNSFGARKTAMKIWDCDISDENGFIRNFVPCYSTTTVTDVKGNVCPIGTIGMYDTVEGKFYTNQGTGEFLYK